jgi:hypothetical protein
MKKNFVAIVVFLGTFLNADYLDVSIGTKPNYNFEEYLFKDINSTNTKKLEKKISYNELHVSGNFNNIIGFNYYKTDIPSPDNFDSKEIYIGSDKTKFFGYQKDETTIHYGTRISTTQTTKYTIYDILTIEQNKLGSTDTETFLKPDSTENTLTDTVFRKFNYDKITLSSENLYNFVKENAIDGENYFYGVAGALNAYSMFRIYGIIIASYEQHDYSNGSTTYLSDVNGTQKLVNIFESSADVERYKTAPKNGRFKGYGYGYKITAEAYWKDLSIFMTSYYKKTSLKNYHTDIRDAEITSEWKPPENIISDQKINFLQQYTSFGLRYRF